ncbi:uncharacterized protein LOC131009824 [Salvia miltiorrhiza]|uniref:uncharacterized protein LOC131009824 n=1 Tax=Salvia miltiorrhiza TaxID=226208 RepID=UPI0025AC9024|nr:uncharacterized protein LOC131009824 [Salvia miltiorrhiza]
MDTSNWKSLFPRATLTSLPVPMSDHVPLLKCVNVVNSLPHRRFRFENSWCLEPELPKVVREYWTNLHGISITEILMAISDSLSIWARYLRKNKVRDKASLQTLISSLQGCRDVVSVRRLKAACGELAHIFLREETYWKQQAKQHWLKDGDTNTRFFHAMALARR